MIATNIRDAWDANESSVYVRAEFEVPAKVSVEELTQLQLRVKYDDGFAAYLNGTLIQTSHANEPMTWDSKASKTQSSRNAVEFQTFDVSQHLHLLHTGKNVLAVQGLNRTATGNDLLILPELVATRPLALDEVPIYVTTDGTDPRGFDGQPTVAPYDGEPIYIHQDTQLQARIHSNEQWSPLSVADYSVAYTASDIDRLFGQMRSPMPDLAFDLNGDNQVNEVDRDQLVTERIGVAYGDANFDGRFDSEDLVAIFVAGQYEDDIAGNSTWGTGDWNGDGEFDSKDLVFAQQQGRYESA